MDILTPFRYCEYKESDANRDLLDCGTFAAHVMAGMSMCEKHAKVVTDALGEQKVTLVRAADKGDSLGHELVDYVKTEAES